MQATLEVTNLARGERRPRFSDNCELQYIRIKSVYCNASKTKRGEATGVQMKRNSHISQVQRTYFRIPNCFEGRLPTRVVRFVDCILYDDNSSARTCMQCEICDFFYFVIICYASERLTNPRRFNLIISLDQTDVSGSTGSFGTSQTCRCR